MGKTGNAAIITSIILLLILIGVAFFYLILYGPRNAGQVISELRNPADGLSYDAAVEAFDESFIFYLLQGMQAYNLHNPPLSKDYPRIEVNVDGEIFNARVDNGIIGVGQGNIAEEDVVIKTTKIEIVKMLKETDYVIVSFNEGGSTIELVASKTTLFAKGYLGLYNKLNGKSITGNIIRIATE